MKNAGKPHEGELHVRFDEGGWNQLPTLSLFDPTIFRNEKLHHFTSGQRADIGGSWYIWVQPENGNTGGHSASQGQKDDVGGPIETQL